MAKVIPPVVLPSGTKKKLLDYILRHDEPVIMAQIISAIEEGELGPMMSSKNIGPQLYSLSQGYNICKSTYPLLQVVPVPQEDETKKPRNGFVKLPHVTEEYMAACEKMSADKKFETAVSKVKQVRVLQPNGTLTMTARDGTEVVVGKRDKQGNTVSVTPMQCGYCHDIQPDISEMQFILGVGWFCKDPCLDRWRKANGYDD